MTFHWPHLLWLILVPALLGVLELSRRRSSRATSHPKILRAEAAPGRLSLDPATATPVARRRFRWRLWLGLALGVVALARPQWGEVEEQVFDQAREILLAVDLSRSMLAPDVPPSRLDRAKLLITSLLERLEGERVGLAVFAGTAFLQSPLSADYEILREFLPSLGPDFLPEGGTDFGAMLQTALEGFGRTEGADRFLIVLSDGESQNDDWHQRVDELRERGIQVIALGIGTEQGAMLPDGDGGFVKDERGAVVLSRLNPSSLEDLARRTGGVYRDASSWIDLAELLEQTVEAGEAGDYTETSRVRRMERFQWVLAPALLLLAWSFGREFPVHPRPRPVRVVPPLPGTASATLVLLLLAALLPAPSAGAAEPAAGNPFAGPLSETVRRLSQQSELSARDLADLAETTITYGQRMLGSQQSPEPGAVADALEAVERGERRDPAAADWVSLREQLQALQPPMPPEQEPPPEEPPPDQSQEDQQPQDQQQGQPSSQDDAQPGEGEPANDQQPANEQENGDEPAESQAAEGQQPSREPREDDSAFGDMNENAAPPDQPAQPQPAEETQQVGGRSERNREAPQDPALTVPLQKLDQLKQQDSPARLYQLMQDPKDRPTETGRDW